MSIRISRIENKETKTSQQKYTYKDISLDIALGKYNNSGLTLKAPEKADISDLIDEAAVINSIRNLTITRKGQKLLNPEYGLNLEDYLFTNITEVSARLMAGAILEAITVSEPRVDVIQVSVIPDEDNQQYLVNIAINIPEINKSTSVSGILNSDSFK